MWNGQTYEGMRGASLSCASLQYIFAVALVSSSLNSWINRVQTTPLIVSCILFLMASSLGENEPSQGSSGKSPKAGAATSLSSAPAVTSSASSSSTAKKMGSSNRNQYLEELSEEHKVEIKEAFDAISKNGGESIDVTELKFAMRALGFEPKKEEIKKIISSVDMKNSGKIPFPHFQQIMSQKYAEKSTRDEILKVSTTFS